MNARVTGGQRQLQSRMNGLLEVLEETREGEKEAIVAVFTLSPNSMGMGTNNREGDPKKILHFLFCATTRRSFGTAQVTPAMGCKQQAVTIDVPVLQTGAALLGLPF